MSASKAEAEAQWLRSTIIPALLRSGKFVDAKIDEFHLSDIQIKFIGAEEAFMLTTCYRATIQFVNVRPKISEFYTRTLIVKKTPDIPQAIFDSINFKALFNNEIEAYTNILPTLEQFTKQKLQVPVFCYGDLQPSAALVVLQDFNDHGWRMSTDKVNLSLPHVLLAAKYLGNFHGVGFALRHAQPQQFASITSTLQESRYAREEIHPDWDLTIKTGVKRVLKAARTYQPQVPSEFLERLQRLIAESYRYGRQRVAPREPMVTLCHGDFLRNNVAYEYGKAEHAEEPQAVLMFDLQTMRVSSPMVDLSVFLGLSAYAAVRHTHFKQIFSAYCDELAAAFTAHSKVALPDFLSYDSLLQEYVRFLPYSIGIAASFLMTLADPPQITNEELLLRQRPEAELIEDAMTRGGEPVDRELAHQVKELYALSAQHGVDVFEGFDYV